MIVYKDEHETRFNLLTIDTLRTTGDLRARVILDQYLSEIVDTDCEVCLVKRADLQAILKRHVETSQDLTATQLYEMYSLQY